MHDLLGYLDCVKILIVTLLSNFIGTFFLGFQRTKVTICLISIL